MKELFYTDDFFGIYEKQDEDTVRCVALMDSEAAPDLTPAETEHYAKLFVTSPELLDELKTVAHLLEQGQLDAAFDGARIKALIERVEG